jgi:hypothetical protein
MGCDKVFMAGRSLFIYEIKMKVQELNPGGLHEIMYF